MTTINSIANLLVNCGLNEVEAFEADREFRLKIFNKKVRQLWKNQCCDKTSELDDLLK